MKKLSLLFFIVFASLGTSAQYYYIPHLTPKSNPGGLNNDDEVIQNPGPPIGFTAIHSGSAANPEWSTTATIPFNFEFNGSVVSQYKASTSGVVTFSTGATSVPSSGNQALPHASIPDNSICVWGLDGFASNDNIAYKTFGTAPNRQYWIMYASYSTPECATQNCFTYWSVVLEETTNKIYVVDQRNFEPVVSLTVGIQINSSTAIQVDGSPNVNTLAKNEVTPVDNVYYEFVYGTQPGMDVAMKSITTNEILSPSGGPYSITGILTNLGGTAINSMDLNYSVDGTTPETQTLSGLNIASQTDYNFSHTKKWTPPAAGTYELKVWASNLNGGSDEDNTNDTITYYLNAVSSGVQRLPMHEMFTSATCGPCAPANANLTNVLNANPNKYTLVKYQMDWPGTGDIYFTQEGGNRRYYYSVSAIPDLYVDGTNNLDAGSYSTSKLNTYYSKAAYVNLDATYSVHGTKVYVDVTIDPKISFNSKYLRLHTVIYEKLTTGNKASNGESEFENVMMKMLPDDKGSIIQNLRKGSPHKISFSYEFTGNYNVEEFSDLGVAVFLQENVSKEMLQSGDATYDNATGINELKEQTHLLNVYPNPSADKVFVNFYLASKAAVSFTLYNTLGELVILKNISEQASGILQQSFDVQALPSGLYLLEMRTSDERHTQTIVVK